jgi:hypothetical protein
MVFREQIEFSLRLGPGRLELVGGGSVFECIFWATARYKFAEQYGIFLLEHGTVRVDGSVISGGAQWHLTREEQELSPFLIVRIGVVMAGGRTFPTSEVFSSGATGIGSQMSLWLWLMGTWRMSSVKTLTTLAVS